jgi:hypothetical protein
VPAHSCQPDRAWNRPTPRRPEEFRVAWPRRQQTFRPGGEPWDLGKDKQDFGEKKNPPKPHASP